jgi:hypothetical protein
VRSQSGDATVGGISPISLVGIAIRYGFYAIGALVLGMIGIGLLTVWSMGAKTIDTPPSFRIASADVARKPVSDQVVTSSKLGRIEVRQYGRLHDRGEDLTVVLAMPPKGVGMGSRFVQDLKQINLLRWTRAVLTRTHYDIDMRFGEYRATEMRVDTDGLWKQCLSFRSRFDEAAVFLTGWYCDGSGSKPSANALACMLDRLVIDRELASKDADAFLRERMARPPRCQAAPVAQTTDTGHRRMSPPSRWSRPRALHR